MKITRIHISELDASLINSWKTIRHCNPELANPYFAVEYLQAVASVKENVFVGVMEESAEVVGFVAWEEKGRGIAGPVGARLSDYQGLIISQQQTWSADELMRACGIKVWDFDHLLKSQLSPSSSFVVTHFSPTIDLANGYQEYLQQMKQRGVKRLFQFQRKQRKFERELGPLDFQLHVDDDIAFEKVIEWKNQQCRATGVPEFMSWPWVRGMLEQIRTIRGDDFSAMLSVLGHEGEIVAAHFGIKSREVIHWWFPVYNHGYGKYSPGGILLLKLMEAASAEGIKSIDLGKGDDVYKESFANGGVEIAEGSFMLPSYQAFNRRLVTGVDSFLRDSAVMAPVRQIARSAKGLLRR